MLNKSIKRLPGKGSFFLFRQQLFTPQHLPASAAVNYIIPVTV